MRWLLCLYCSSALFAAAPTTRFGWVEPEEAFSRLMQGNARYVADQLAHPDRSTERRLEVSSQQKPFAIILGCSDSRVPPEIVFDQGLGDIFVIRVAGQVAGPIELDSIEYAVKYLGSSVLMVLGHQACGAVSAVLKGQTKEIEEVANLIQPAIASLQIKTVENAVKANVRWVVANLEKTPLIAQMLHDKRLKVVGGYYCLSSGKVELVTP